ncbi:ComEC/Rec2 family competence protein [Candidatus Kaiserbacteria bacterium]|nr:ComEC/Rec2 family competence protein [Candidatus Kaiserbacteria bacterium]
MQSFLYAVIGGFAFGVLSRSLFNFGVYLSLFVVILGMLVLSFALLVREKRRVLILGILVLSMGSGLLRFDIADMKKGSAVLEKSVSARIAAEGIVIDEPDVRERNTNYTVLLENISGENVRDRVRIVVESYPQFQYGDRVSIRGELQKPDGFTTDNGRYFDYGAFLSKDDIFYQMLFPTVDLTSEGHGNPIKRRLFAFKRSFLESVQKSIPDPEVSLLGGLVVGAKQSLGEKLQEDFRTTGIIHIVVLSGYNVTIVADAMMRALSFLPRTVGMSFGAVAIILFAVMTGASATIVRASIMALLVILARATGRTYDITRALFIAGFFMILHNPKILLHDTSFQLSFLATLGLIWLAPIIERRLHFIPGKFQFREVATATLSTQIFVLPLLLYKMGELSLVALPVNLLVLLTVPVTMFFGFLTGMLGFVSLVLALPFGFISYLFLSYQLRVVEFFAELPFASVHLNVFPLFLMLGLYGFYAIVLWKIHKNTPLVPSKKDI